MKIHDPDNLTFIIFYISCHNYFSIDKIVSCKLTVLLVN